MSKILILFLLPFSLLFSNDLEEFPFLGVTVETKSVDLKDISDQKVTTLGVRYGKQTVDWRTMFTYTYKQDTYRSFGMQIDNILLDEIMGNPEYRPYLGFSAGAIEYKDDALTETKGYFYGIHAGLLVYVTDTIDADISYNHYNIIDIKSVDKISGASISLHYFY